MRNHVIMGLVLVCASPNAYGFSKIQHGLETLTSGYLIPLSNAVAGASFIAFVTLSLFKQEEYQKKVAQVAILSILASGGLTLINQLFQIFS